MKNPAITVQCLGQIEKIEMIEIEMAQTKETCFLSKIKTSETISDSAECYAGLLVQYLSRLLPVFNFFNTLN